MNNEEPKRLYRSVSNRVVGGVAAGLANYFNLDPILVRLLFVIFTLFGGGAVLIYIILWIITPDEPYYANPIQNQPDMETDQNQQNEQQYQQQQYQQEYQPQPNQPQDPNKNPNPTEKRMRGNLIGGLVLITIGGIFLVDQFIPRIDFGDLWPVVLIVIGIALLINAFGRKKNQNN
jgi:phage shock protein C